MLKKFFLIVLVYNNLLICTDEDKKLEEDKKYIELEEGARKRSSGINITSSTQAQPPAVQAAAPQIPERQHFTITRSYEDFQRQAEHENKRTYSSYSTVCCFFAMLSTYMNCCIKPWIESLINKSN